MTETELLSPDQIRDQVRQTTDDLWDAMRDGNEEKIIKSASHLKVLVERDQKAAVEALREDPDLLDDMAMRLWAIQGLSYAEVGAIFGLSRKSVGTAIDRAIKAQEDLAGSDPRERWIAGAIASYREVMRTSFPKMSAGSIQAAKVYLAAQDALAKLLGLNAPDKKMVSLGGMGPQLVHLRLPPKDDIGEVVDSEAVEIPEGEADG